MNIYKLIKDDDVLIESIEPAFHIISRMRGLLGRKSLSNGHALYIKPCGSIHTIGMQFNLDLIFLDKNLRVVNIVCNVAPVKMVLGGKHAASVVELESGWFDWNKLRVGDNIKIL